MSVELEDIEAYFRVLGLEPGAPLAAVKEEYRNSVQAFHTDKFPEGSSSQKWAKEKFIQINNAYEAIKDWYKDNPSGEPPDGWPSKRKPGGQGAAAAAGEGGGSADSTDWQAWEKKNEGGFTEEVRSWEQREQERQKTEKETRERANRAKLVTLGKHGLAICLFLLWMGRGCSSTGSHIGRDTEDKAWQDKWDYILQTHGTSLGPYPMSDEDIKRRANEEKVLIAKKWQDQDTDRGISQLFMLVLSGGCIWLYVGKKPKVYLEKFINEGKI